MSPAQSVLAAAMTEAELQDAIIEYAHTRGWLVAHFRPLPVAGRFRRNAKGEFKQVWMTPVQADGDDFPDLVLGRGGVTLVWECKRQGEQATPGQQAWLDATGGRVVYPADWLSGEIELELEWR